MEPIRFYKTTEEYGCFSNFSAHPILMEGKVWPTSEHYFQAQKFTDAAYQEKIRTTASPMIAARLGRSRAVPIRSGWDSMRDEVMYRAVRAKFEQRIDLQKVLLSTGNREIIEHIKRDSYWGDGGDGTGKNKLGKILMRVRAEFGGSLAPAEPLKLETEIQSDLFIVPNTRTTAKPKKVKEPKPMTNPEIKTIYRGKFLEVNSIENWEYVARPQAVGVVAILAITPQDEILLVEQYRKPVQSRLIELPAGLVGDTHGVEDEVEAAKRELLEETGYVAKEWKFLTRVPSSAGLTSESVDIFLATGLESTGPALGDGTEELEQHKIARKDLKSFLEQQMALGKMIDQKIFTALYFVS